MGATALLKGIRLPRRAPRPARRAGRTAVIAWAIAAVALVSAGGSLVMRHGAGAEAKVLALTGDAHAPTDAPAEALIDPTEYRRQAPAADGRPRIAIIVRGLAISESLTAKAIADLPPDITLAFSPYGRALQKTADAARGAGHEIFLDIPVEPGGFPANDAGPQAVLTTITPAENLERLTWSMARFTGYAGIAFPATSPVLDSPDTLRPVLEAPAAQGLVWAHTGAKGFTAQRIESARITATLDDIPKAAAIETALQQLEAKARSGGSALGLATAYPVSVEVLARWAATLDERGFQLVPASALAVAPAS